MTTAIERDAQRWRIAAIALCAIAMMLWAASLFGSGYGLGGLPRTALWGMQLVPGAPFTFRVTSLDPGGAADRAGIRPGDIVDTRMQSPIARFWILNEPVAWSTVELTILRDGRPLHVAVAMRVLDVTRPDILSFFVAMAWMIAFAALLAWRKPESREVRLLSLTLVLLAISDVVVNFSFRDVWLYAVAFIAHNGLQATAVILWAFYTGCFARPASSARRGLQLLCVVLAGIAIAVAIAAVIGELTLRFSSGGYLHLYGGRDETWHIPYDGAVALATVCSALSIFASRGEERQRAVWSLVPLTLLFVANAVTSYVLGVQSDYAALLFWIAFRNLINFVVPISLTYAALGKRLIGCWVRIESHVDFWYRFAHRRRNIRPRGVGRERAAGQFEPRGSRGGEHAGRIGFGFLDALHSPSRRPVCRQSVLSQASRGRGRVAPVCARGAIYYGPRHPTATGDRRGSVARKRFGCVHPSFRR